MSSAALSFTVQVRSDPLPDDQREAVLADPGFGRTFTDHMVLASWTTAEGWHDAKVTAYGPLSLDPSAAVLHYAQEIFEGMKAYRHADGSVWTFRPEVNAARFARSARRLALPELSETDFIESLRALVSTDQKWVPVAGGGEAKCGGNYAASLAAQVQGTANGCDQVAFLDALERKWVEELGGMNLFFVF